MPTFTFECANEAELALVCQAARFASEMHHLTLAAPTGSALSAAEGLALDAGRRLLCAAIQSATQARIDADELKGGPHAAARARPRAASRGGTAAT